MAKRVEKKPEPELIPALRLEWRSPAELAVNPKNWRQHPPEQEAALQALMSEVGWAGACLFNERTGRLIDGHLRQKVSLLNGADKIPVLVGSWDEETESKILLTLDPIAAMAEADAAKLDALLREVETSSMELAAMLTELAEENGIVPGEERSAPEDFGTVDENIETEHECPKCGYRFSGGSSHPSP